MRGKRGQVYQQTVEAMGFNAIQGDLNQYDIQNWIVSTPDEYHYEHAKFLLENKCNVLLEKFPCENKEEFNHLVDLAKTNNCKLEVGWTFVYNPLINLIPSVLDRHPYRTLSFIWGKPGINFNDDLGRKYSCHHLSIIAYLFKNIAWYEPQSIEVNDNLEYFEFNFIDHKKYRRKAISAIFESPTKYHIIHDYLNLQALPNPSPIEQQINNWLYNTRPEINTIDITNIVLDSMKVPYD